MWNVPLNEKCLVDFMMILEYIFSNLKSYAESPLRSESFFRSRKDLTDRAIS